MRLVLCENGLVSREGHHFNLVVGVRAELARHGLPLSVLSHIRLDPALGAELGATPVFEMTPYFSLMGARGRGIGAWLRAGWTFARGLRRARLDSDDVLLVLTARPAELLGVALWSWTRRSRPRAVVLNFMTDDFRVARTDTSPALVGWLYRFGHRLLRLRLGRRRLLLTSGSESLAASVGRRLRAPVTSSPVLKAYPEPTPPRTGSTPTIGFLGSPRADKGEAVLARVLENCAAWLPDVEVVVQLPSWFPAPGRGWPENLRVVPVGLDREGYFELLGGLDLVVLPYRAEAFGDMVSGIFAEAVAFGAAAVVPAGTWMAGMIERGRAAGVVFDRFDVSAIVTAIAIAEDRLGELRRESAALAAAWRAEQSISAYFGQLLAELDHRAARLA